MFAVKSTFGAYASSNPSGIFSYLIIGGGGSGGGHGTSVTGGGAGAGGKLAGTYTNTLSEVITVTVGAGGAGGAGLNATGSAGASSSLVSSTAFPTASFTASPAGTNSTTLTISSVSSGTVAVGMVLTSGIAATTAGFTNPYISAFGTFNGSSGTVTLSWASTWANNASITGSNFASLGGGAGASFPLPGAGGSGAAGASGGGCSGAQQSGTPSIASQFKSGQGNAGAIGTGNLTVNACTGGGGGGAGGAASAGSSTGGVGSSSSITGSPVTYATGGNGSSGTAATANTGDGGGGSTGSGGGAGGSGVVILSIPTAFYTGITTGGPNVTTSGIYTILKFTASGSYTSGSSFVTPTDSFWNDVVLMLAGEGTNATANRVMVDSSTNNASITNTGNVTQGNYAPYNTSGWGSVFYGGGTSTGNLDYISFPSNAGYALGTGDDFTFDAWVYINQFSSSLFPIWQSDVSLTSSSGTIWLGVAPTGIQIGKHGGGNPNITFSGTFNTGVWYNIRVTRSGTTTYGFQNGNLLGSSASFSGISFSQSGGLMGFRITPNYAFGYISNFRYVKGTALSTAAYTVGTTPYTAISGTQFLENGTNGGILDSAFRADLVTLGNVQITTSTVESGTGAITFDGSGDYLTTVSPTTYGTTPFYSPPQTITSILSGDFTIEAWVNNTGTSGRRAIASQWDQTGTSGWILSQNAGTYEFFFYPFSNSSAIITAGTVATNTFQHVAVTRSGSTFTLWLNGTSAGTNTSAATGAALALPHALGSYYNASHALPATGSTDFAGVLDNVRITRGVARYTATFTPPSQMFITPTTSDYVEVLLTGEGTNGSTTITDSSKNAATITNASSLITITTADFAVGTSSISFPGNTSAYLATPASRVYNIGNLTDWSVDFYVKITSAPAAAYCLVSSGTGAAWNTQLNFQFYMNASRLLGFEYSDGTLSPPFTGYLGTAVPLNAWNHIALTYSAQGKVLRTFLNGVFNFETTVPTWAPPAAVPSLTFGRSNPAVVVGSAYPLSGLMDQIRVSRNLSLFQASFTP